MQEPSSEQIYTEDSKFERVVVSVLKRVITIMCGSFIGFTMWTLQYGGWGVMDGLSSDLVLLAFIVSVSCWALIGLFTPYRTIKIFFSFLGRIGIEKSVRGVLIGIALFVLFNFVHAIILQNLSSIVAHLVAP